jgi:hypothetical protein
MIQAKSNIVRTLAFMSVGFLLGYIIAYLLLHYQFESFKYSSIVRNVVLYEEVIELLDDGNQGEVKRRMIDGLEKDLSILSGCLDGYCADGRNEYYKQTYERLSMKFQDIKQNKM